MSGVSPSRLGISILSWPFEIIKPTTPAGETFPPPPGWLEIILPLGISSLKTSSTISVAKPRSASDLLASD